MSARAKLKVDSAIEGAGNGQPAGRWVLPERVTGIQRARMLAAMAEVCAELGAANVTVSDVVARSGVSRRTFYEQFSDREACFLESLEEALSSAARSVLPAYDAPARWREKIRAGVVALLSFMEDEPYVARLLFVETLAAGPRAMARRHEALSHVLAAVDQGRGRGPVSAELPALTAEATVGGVVHILHDWLIDPQPRPLLEMAGELTSMLVLPYLGPAAARKELRKPAPTRPERRTPSPANPLHDLGMRLTYRTIRVLLSVAAHPGSSNRELGAAAEINDQGQVSKLLTRLAKLGLIENTGAGHARGAPNAWMLTERGAEMQRTISQQASGLVAA